MKNNIELLSPARNKDSFLSAINAGADAIYMGLDRFNARTMAKNFNVDEYIESIKYAHMIGVKVYLTLNTLVYDEEIKDALELLIKLYSAGLDAVILQDIGLAKLIHELLPKLALHASTQMSIYNLEQVKFLEKIGFKRVVLARELTLSEIEYICKNTSLEIEVFVHGALCVCYSGQCLLSSYIGNRSANRGNCAQPCRMKYSLYNQNKELVPNKYILSKKDIFGLSYIQRLYNIGVHSLKLEGRNKTPEYVAGVTKIYRKYLNDIINKNNEITVNQIDKKNLMQIFNRDGISDGYLGGVCYKNSITENIPKNTGIYLGKIILQKKEFVKIKLEEDISLHDGIEILDENDVIFSNVITCIKDERKNIVNETIKKGNYVWLGDVKKKVKIGDKVFKTSDYGMNKNLKEYYTKSIRKRNIDISIDIKKGNKLSVRTLNLRKNIFVSLDDMPDIAKSKPTTKEKIIESFNKTKDSPFIFNILDIEMDEDIFVPISILNELRRTFVQRASELFVQDINVDNNIKLLNEIISKYDAKILDNREQQNNENLQILHIYNFDKKIDYFKLYFEKYGKKLNTVYIEISDFIKYKESIISSFYKNSKIYLVLPNIGGNNTDKYIFSKLKNEAQYINGLVIGNVGYIDLALKLKEKYDIKLIADYSLNVFNRYSAIFYIECGFDIITPSVELKDEYIENLDKYAPIEIVSDYKTLMTSRYCILGAFIEERKQDSKCSMPCLKKKYYLVDSHNLRYNIVCNNLDCIMKLISKSKSRENILYRNRHVII